MREKNKSGRSFPGANSSSSTLKMNIHGYFTIKLDAPWLILGMLAGETRQTRDKPAFFWDISPRKYGVY